MWNVFEINSNDTRTTSATLIWCLYSYLLTGVTHSSGISIGDFELVNAGLVDEL